MRFDDASPIYQQIAAHFREEILAGNIVSGEQIMSTTVFSREYRINPATVNKAYGLLADEGLIEKRRGIGMFVTPQAQHILRAHGRKEYRDSVLGPALREGIALGFSVKEVEDLAHLILRQVTDSHSDTDKS